MGENEQNVETTPGLVVHVFVPISSLTSLTALATCQHGYITDGTATQLIALPEG